MNASSFAATPQQVRAERGALLATIERRSGTSASSSRRHAFLMFAAAALAIVAFFTERMVTRQDTAALRAPAAASSPVFDVSSIHDAVWQSRVEGGTVRGTLTRGSASFHVEHLGTGQRFLLTLPDGDLEVRGTRFTVRVGDGVTEQVDVTEGVVALHIAGRGEIVLRAGEHWPPPVAAPAAPASVPSIGADTAGDAPEIAPASATTHASAKGPSAAAAPELRVPSTTEDKGAPLGAGAPIAPASIVSEAKRATASERFVAAMAAFNSGAYAPADTLLAAFVADYPGDPRGEDARFLRAVAHERMGDHAGAAALASAYLRAYPGGLRSQDARRLADAPKP